MSPSYQTLGGVAMKKFFDYADQYIQESDWKVLAALKLCLLSLGICLRLSVA